MITEPTLRRRVFVPVTAGFVILTMTIAGSFRWYQSQHLQNAVAGRLETVIKTFENQRNSDAEAIRGLIDGLEKDISLRQAYLAKDRDRLLRAALPIFEEFRSKYRVTHFYFHDPKRACFLRVHEPGRHGDVVQRTTMAASAETGKTSHGIELGPSGTFTLRIVRPWKVNDQLIGYIELGEEIAHILPRMKDLVGVELAVTVGKAHLDRAKWEQGMKMMGRKPEWGKYEDFVVIDTTLPGIPDEVGQVLRIPHSAHAGRVVAASVGDTQYRCGLLPLIDAGGRDVGDLAALLDVSADAHASWPWPTCMTP